MKKLLLSILVITLTLSLIACEEEVPNLLEETEDVSDADDIEPNQPAEEPSAFPYQFTATDVYGNTVTESDLGEKEMFLVYQWATWCGPCVNGMPKLAQIAEKFQDKVGFIALIDDYDSNLDGAINIIESSGIPETFFMVDANGDGVKSLIELVETGFFPSSVIIYKGELIGPKAGGNYDLIEGLLGE